MEVQGEEREERKETHKTALEGLQCPRQGLLLQVGPQPESEAALTPVCDCGPRMPVLLRVL